MARYVALSSFSAYQDFSVGDVLDSVADPRVNQLVADGAPVALEDDEVSEQARIAKYFSMSSISPNRLVATASAEYLEIGGSWPPPEWGTPVRTRPRLFINLSGSGPNLIEMRGDNAGQFAVFFPDGGSMVLNGQVNANSRWSPINGVDPLVGGRAYCVGGASDFNQNGDQTFAIYISLSAHVGLDHFQGFKLGDTRHRVRIMEDGQYGIGDGVTSAPDIIFQRQAAGVAEFLIENTKSVARLAEAAAGETALLLRRNVGGVFTMERVSMGIDNSGGAGFKLLRVPN